MMETKDHVCPGCPRHCDLSMPGCERGRSFTRTGALPGRPRPSGYGPERQGPHGPGRGHFHGPGGPEGPRPPRSVTEAEFYPALDDDAKILALLRELGRLGHLGPDGRGGQDRVLRVLSSAGSMSQRELTGKLGIQPGSASEILSKLEAAGLITRTQSETDRRGVDLSLTRAGAARATELNARPDAGPLLSALSIAERAELLALLEKLSASAAGRR